MSKSATSSWFNISEDIWVVWSDVETASVLQRPSMLGCWVFAFRARSPATGTRASAPEGRRWLLTELVFQNIRRHSCSLGSPRPFDHRDCTEVYGGEGSCKEEPGGLAVNTWMDWKACPEVGCIFLSPRDRTLPFFLWTEPRLEIRKSPVHVPQESRKGYCFPFHMRRLPCPGMALRKHPNVCIIRGSRMSFK